MKRKSTLLATLLSAWVAIGSDVPTRVISYDFMSVVVELTIDSLPDIQGMKVKVRNANGGLDQLLDKTEFKDWRGGVTRFEGIVHMGSDVDIITAAIGTGTGTYYLHKYRVDAGKVTLVKSEMIYDWGLRPPKDELTAGQKKNLVLKQETNDLWNVHFDVGQ